VESPSFTLSFGAIFTFIFLGLFIFFHSQNWWELLSLYFSLSLGTSFHFF
jgi:hypothetical protein